MPRLIPWLSAIGLIVATALLFAPLPALASTVLGLAGSRQRTTRPLGATAAVLLGLPTSVAVTVGPGISEFGTEMSDDQSKTSTW